MFWQPRILYGTETRTRLGVILRIAFFLGRQEAEDDRQYRRCGRGDAQRCEQLIEVVLHRWRLRGMQRNRKFVSGLTAAANAGPGKSYESPTRNAARKIVLTGGCRHPLVASQVVGKAGCNTTSEGMPDRSHEAAD